MQVVSRNLPTGDDRSQAQKRASTANSSISVLGMFLSTWRSLPWHARAAQCDMLFVMICTIVLSQLASRSMTMLVALGMLILSQLRTQRGRYREYNASMEQKLRGKALLLQRGQEVVQKAVSSNKTGSRKKLRR